MLPEAVHMGSAGTIRWAVLGLLLLFFLERFFSFHQHQAPAQKRRQRLATGSACLPADPHHHLPGDHSPASARGSFRRRARPEQRAAIGLAVHSLVGGVALATAVAAQNEGKPGSGGIGWGVFLATAVHKPADALTIVSLMLHAGVPRWLAHFMGGIRLRDDGPPGDLVVSPRDRPSRPGSRNLLHGSPRLAFSAGTFLCIALSDLLPELQFHSHDRLKLSIALLLGVGLMAGENFCVRVGRMRRARRSANGNGMQCLRRRCVFRPCGT